MIFDYNLLANLEYCYSFFQDSAGLLLYTHIPAIIASLVFGGFVLWKKRDLSSVLLAAVAVVFSIFSVLDLLQWIWIDRNTFIMASWSVLGLLSILLFFFTHWFVHESVTHKPLSRWMIIAWILASLPVIVMTPTTFNVSGYDIRDCIAVEGTWFTNYYYAVGLFAIVLMAVSAYLGMRKRSQQGTENRAARLVITVGAELFTLAFLVTGAVASYLVDQGYIPDFGLAQYGVAAMALFIGILAYASVRYHAFNLRMLGAQVLVIAFTLLIAAEFLFVEKTIISYGLVGVTLFLDVIFGWLLVRGVKQEIAQRVRIEKLAQELELTNQRQESLIHFVGHEVKGYLTKDMGAFAALVEGDLGPVPDNMKTFIQGALAQSRDGANSVIDILHASNQKKGTVEYKKEPFDLAALVTEWYGKVKPLAEKKGLVMNLSLDEAGKPYTVTGDGPQTGEHVLRNLFENSVNYTPSGHVDVSLKKVDKMAVLTISDTGVGISQEDKKRLFTEGGKGKDSLKVNVHSTGYGLFIAKNVVEAEGGTVRAESEGPGKGSQFIVEFPTA